MIIKNKHLIKYYHVFNILFWCVSSVIFTVTVASVIFGDSGGNAKSMVAFFAVFVSLCVIEQIAYIKTIRQVLDIIDLNDTEVLFVFFNKSVTIKKSDCVKIVETNSKYVFVLKNGKKMAMRKEHKLFDMMFLKSDKVKHKTFPDASFENR